MRSAYKYWKFIWVLLLTTACLPGGRELTGIWHAEFEMVPGLRSALDIQLSQDITGKWSGRFEIPELMAASELQAVNVQGAKIELNLGAGAVFKGELSEDKTAIRGVLDVPEQKPENVTFTKVPHWSAQIPARAGKNGQPVKSWKYQPPPATGDGWRVGLLPESVADSKLLNELFEQITQGKFHGLDAFLVAQHGGLILEEYFYLGGRERLHSIQSATKSVTSLFLALHATRD